MQEAEPLCDDLRGGMGGRGGGIYIYLVGGDIYIIMIDNGKGNGTQLQHSCLENPMDGGAW